VSLENGMYDAFIVWAEQREHGVALECVITSGAHKGDMINIVTSTFTPRDPMSLIGVACTLVVDRDTIRVTA
jgi:hypothetical protein